MTMSRVYVQVRVMKRSINMIMVIMMLSMRRMMNNYEDDDDVCAADADADDKDDTHNYGGFVSVRIERKTLMNAVNMWGAVRVMQSRNFLDPSPCVYDGEADPKRIAGILKLGSVLG